MKKLFFMALLVGAFGLMSMSEATTTYDESNVELASINQMDNIMNNDMFEMREDCIDRCFRLFNLCSASGHDRTCVTWLLNCIYNCPV